MNLLHNKYHNHECHTCNPEQVYYDNHEHTFPKKSCSFPTYKTMGTHNPYYKCVPYYILNNAPQRCKQILQRCVLEDYFEEFLGKGFLFNSKPGIDIRQYYFSIAVWLKAVYRRLRELKVTYSNLNEHDSALIVIRRILSKFVCEEEMCKIATLFDLNLMLHPEHELGC